MFPKKQATICKEKEEDGVIHGIQDWSSTVSHDALVLFYY
jgi:hypothetical protein